ncbi:hypothetical protein PQX77_009822 [Marasmius sp. AFHP31]|nr:hypothetical protein PQX77_009822 [Marasmius sp. AFHP31]
MTVLSQTLGTFLRHAPEVEKRCFMLVYPNPRLWLGLREQTEPPHRDLAYLVAFGRGHDPTMVAGQNAWGISYSQNYSYWQSLQDKLQFSAWCQVDSQGGLRKSLMEVLDSFPNHDLSTKRGVELAAKEIDSCLRPNALTMMKADDRLVQLGKKVNLSART